MTTKELRKFIGNAEGDLFCAICNRKGEWEDCPTHPDDHYSVYCPKCGVDDKDCENYARVEESK
jgi:hypothetical protein